MYPIIKGIIAICIITFCAANGWLKGINPFLAFFTGVGCYTVVSMVSDRCVALYNKCRCYRVSVKLYKVD